MSQTPQQPPSVPPEGSWAPASKKRVNPVVLAAIALIAAVVAAGAFFVISGGDDGRREDYIDALTSGGAAEDSAFDLSEEELRCMAEVQVDVVGVDQLAERFTPEELEDRIQEDPAFQLDLGEPTESEAGRLVDGMDRCWDFFERMRSGAVEVPSATPEISACINEALDDSFLREAMIEETMNRAVEELNTVIATRVQDLCGHLE